MMKISTAIQIILSDRIGTITFMFYYRDKILLLGIIFIFVFSTSTPAQNEPVESWVAANAISLRTVEAGRGFDDLQPLKKIVGSARVVALGEATHGTREFFQLKHRMLEFLVNEMGFTVFGIEASMPEAFDINRYVLTGQGNPRKALAALNYWTWDTEEVLALIEWMRRYNANPKHFKKVKFYGFDMGFAPRAAKVTIEYLRQADPEAAKQVETQLASIANPFLEAAFPRASKEEKANLILAVNNILARFSDQKQNYVKRTSPDEFSIAEQHARILSQYAAMMQVAGDSKEVLRVRDKALGDNIQWAMDREGKAAKMVVWAHNSHVAHKADLAMGTHLRKMFGNDLVIFGFAFNRGSFVAMDLPPSEKGLQTFTVGPGPVDSLDATLAAAGLKIAAIDLRTLPKDGEVAKWFDEVHKTKWMGAVYSDKIAEQQLFPLIIKELFDALFFIENTTAARQIDPTNTRAPQAKLPAPINLDFEDSHVEAAPNGWMMPATLLNYDFKFVTSSDRPFKGKSCGLLSRAPGRHYGEMTGGFIQRVDAASYRGKQVRLRAAVRAETIGSDSHAYIRLRIDKNGMGQAVVIADSRDRYPITNSDWREVEIVMSIPNDADAIGYGLVMVGDGKVWIDAVSIEPVGK